jgi:ribonucleotide reductase alpha subunit
VFKAGSGSGGNYSKIRGSKEPLSNGGTSSGLMSFLPMIDANAGAIKSGGTTRRAARMVVLDLNHPDIEEFIWWKVREEKKVAALIVGSRAIKEVTKKAHHAAFVGDKVKLAAARAEAATIGVPYETVKQAVEAGKQKLACPEIEEFNHAYEGTAYRTVTGQNANNSVSVTNEFMRLVESGGDWRLYNRTELRRAEREGRAPKPRKTLKARDLWNQVAYAAWQCADPGVQFRTTMNDWNTVANDGEITATNPCQPGFATVLTPNGVRTFDDIEVGSTIWSGVRWTRVIRKIATGIKPVSIYHTTAGRFVGTKDHKVIENGSRVSAEIADGIDRCVGPKHVDQLSIDPQDVVDENQKRPYSYK